MDSVYEDNMMPMFVATNNKKVNGAGVILYDGLLITFAEKIGGDFYILPSSVHEVIFVPANGDMDARYLIQMVREVNATQGKSITPEMPGTCNRCGLYLNTCSPIVENGFLVGAECDYDYCCDCPYYEECGW